MEDTKKSKEQVKKVNRKEPKSHEEIAKIGDHYDLWKMIKEKGFKVKDRT